MTISTTQNSQVLLGNGATFTFDFSFVADAAALINVIYTDALGNQTVLSPSTYTLVINAPATGQLWGIGGTLTYPLTGAPIASGTSLTIQRTLPLQQLTALDNQGDFYPAAVEGTFDTQEMQLQQVAASSARAIQVPAVDNNVTTLLPAAAARANQYLAFDSLGNAIVRPGTSNNPVNPVNYGFNNFILTPASAPPPPLSGLAISLPSGTVIFNGLTIGFPAINATLNNNSIYDYWLNADGTLTTEIGTQATYTALPNFVPTKMHLWRVYTQSGSVLNVIQMSNTYPTVLRPGDGGLTIDNFVEQFYLYATTTNWSSGASATYGELILTTDGNVYQVANPCPPGTVLGTVKPTSTAAGAIINGTATLFYYCQHEYLGNFRYAANNGAQSYFTNLGLRRVAHRSLLTGSPLGPAAGTAMTTLIKNYILNQFQQLICPRVNSGTYIKNMKMIAGGYIWLCTTAGAAAGSSPYSGSYTPGSSTVTDGTAIFLCLYASYSTQKFFWMDTDRTFLTYVPPDSHDSYAGTFVSLIARYLQLVPGDAGFIFGASAQPSGSSSYYSYKTIFDNIVTYNLTNQIANNLTYTFQNGISPVDGTVYAIQFLEDNCESYSGFSDASYLYGLWGDGTNQSAAATNASNVSGGIAALYDTTYNIFATQYGEAVSTWIASPDKPLYPRLNSQFFPELHNVPSVNQDSRNNVRIWVGSQYADWWLDRGKDTFPQNNLGFLAARMWQDFGKAYAFIENTERYFLTGGLLEIHEFCYYLDIKDNLVNPFTLLQQTGTQITVENVGQQLTTLNCNSSLEFPNAAAAFTLTLPANAYISDIFVQNTAGNALTGGLDIGTTLSGNDIVSAFAVGASSVQMIPQASLLKRVFSASAAQILYFAAHSSWNSANITVQVRYSSL